MKWTDEQKLVIDTRDKNMLVSAAAGSGKTAVLVERIISRVLDPNNPLDVDSILVVTFTTAAAGEMKGRVREAIDKALLDNPDNERLRAQATLVHNAQIRTIDSFCSYVVKNYFYEIDIDPGFRIGTKGELDLLADECLDEILNSKFSEKDENFLSLAKAYVQGVKVDDLKKIINALHKRAASYPWPNQWYDSVLVNYKIDSIDELKKSTWVSKCLETARNRISYWSNELERIVSFYPEDDASKDGDILRYELKMLKAMAQEQDWDKMKNLMDSIVYQTLRFTSKSGLPEDIVPMARNVRNAAKELIVGTSSKKGLRQEYFSSSMSDLFELMSFTKIQAIELVELAKAYDSLLMEKKLKKNVFDFNDIEHLALCILKDKDDITHPLRPVALELKNHFKEVMVDEYQDSNQLQEEILTAIACDDNYFVVGDVKQSIYAFRQASPKLFIEKFERYPNEPEKNIRIDLDQNFRSRSEVLEVTNEVFFPLMKKDVGGVDYDEKVSLKYGAKAQYDNFFGDFSPKILIGDYSKEEAKEAGIKSKEEFEGRMIAKAIKELMDSDFLVVDKDPVSSDKTIQRKIRYSDIVILLRATKGTADAYLKVLRDKNIPAYVAEEKGFFDREEVQDVLSFLMVIDNPYNDIPLTAAMHSPMFGITTDELATIRAYKPEGSFFNCVFEYASEHPEKQKIKYFVETLAEFRTKALDFTIHEILNDIFVKTGYMSYVSARPAGELKRANLEKLMDEAVIFESTSYKGLSRFVAYINDLKTYDEELGLASTVSENDNAVRIMTIHKSKGLEFPVVFLSDTGRHFKTIGSDLSYHESYGIGLNYKNPYTRTTVKLPLVAAIDAKNKEESYGEEQRILYVAMTRAKEKLVITGCIDTSKKDSNLDDKLNEIEKLAHDPLSYQDKLESNSYLMWVLMALSARNYGIDKIHISVPDLIMDEVVDSTSRHITKSALLEFAKRAVEENRGEEVIEKLSFEYERAADSKYKNKYSVSELKHESMEDAFGFTEDAAKPNFLQDEAKLIVPNFMRDEKIDLNASEGALFGTAMHRFMECFDFASGYNGDTFDEQLTSIKNRKLMNEDDLNRINLKKLKKFMGTSLAKRMSLADENHKLYKEQPFVFGTSPKELYPNESTSDDFILVQGIIDAFFEEDDGIVLLDYKTDKVDTPQELMLRYERQLNLYKYAIEKAYSKKVKEMILYSFSLDMEVSI